MGEFISMYPQPGEHLLELKKMSGGEESLIHSFGFAEYTGWEIIQIFLFQLTALNQICRNANTHV